MFEGNCYLLKEGLQMGCPISPGVAKIVVHCLEQEWIKIKNYHKITYKVRYMDDYLGKWIGAEDELDVLVSDINKSDEKLKFTIEKEVNGRINFLDASIVRGENSIIFSAFEKECSSSVYLPGDSYQDTGIKRAAVIGETIRLKKFSDKFEEDQLKLREKFLHNGYNSSFVDTNMKKGIQQFDKPKQDKLSKSKSNEGPKLITSYMGKKTNKLKKKLKPFNIKVINRRRVNLEGMFASKYKYKTNYDKGIVYKIYCECGAFYIGESCSDFKCRKYQHNRDIKAKSFSNALFKHMFEEEHLLEWDKSTLLSMQFDKSRRKITEAILIKNQKPEININDGLKILGNWKL